MKTSGLTIAAFVVSAGAAYAADLAPKTAEPVVPITQYDWTGFYVGANAGLGRGQSAVAVTISGGGQSATQKFRRWADQGYVTGLQAGYNYQFGSFVLGAEVDGDLTRIRGSWAVSPNNSPGAITTFNSDLKWLASARLRAGYTFDRALFYATGGVAAGQIENGYYPNVFSWSNSDTKWGWTAGLGIEYAVTNSLSAKIEYRHTTLEANDFQILAGGILGLGQKYKNSFDIMTIGLNYHLYDENGLFPPVGSVVTASTPHDWSGFYAGANLGYGMARSEEDGIGGVTGTIPQHGGTWASHGILAGLQAGYNYQLGSIVLGAEIDGDYSGISGSMTESGTGLVIGTQVIANTKLDWVGSGRLRAGYAFDRALFYATGGVAVGKVNNGIQPSIGGPVIGNTKSGWTAGLGVEYAVTDNISTKLEYRHVALGDQTLTADPGTNVYNLSRNTYKNSFDLVKIGLNYHL